MLHLFFYLTSDLSIDLNINLKDDLMKDSIIIKELKEWNRIYWMEKNRMMPLHWSIRDMKTAYEKYFPRVWNTFDTEDTTEEFENAWKDYITSTKSEQNRILNIRTQSCIVQHTDSPYVTTTQDCVECATLCCICVIP
jgi:hypothetical protein